MPYGSREWPVSPMKSNALFSILGAVFELTSWLDHRSQAMAEEHALREPNAVSIQRIGPEAAALLSNLLELYIHDLSEVFPVKLGPDGRFGYDKLPIYWSAPHGRSAFLITCGGEIAGFALVTRGSPATSDPTDLDLAEFFVLRSYRRSRGPASGGTAVGSGSWKLGGPLSDANGAGLHFWRDVVREDAGDHCVETLRSEHPHGWTVFTFASRPSQ